MTTAGIIILLAYFIRGITGFGSGLIAVPLLAHILPLQMAVPLILITDFSASVAMSRVQRGNVAWNEIRPLLPFGLIGVILGVTLLIHVPQKPLMTTLSFIIILFALRNMLNLGGQHPISRAWAGPAGLAGGTIGALFGTGGPPYVVYLTHRISDKSQLRATFSGLFMIDGGVRIIVFTLSGLLLHVQLLWAIALAVPLMALGLFLGNRVHVGLSSRQMHLLVGLLLFGSGISLLWKSAS